MNKPLNKISLNYKDELDYSSVKGWITDELIADFKTGLPYRKDNVIRRTINTVYFYHCEDEMKEYGMERAAITIATTLWAIDKDDLPTDMAKEVNFNIKDLRTGEYDSLFTDEDLKLLQADMDNIEKYLNEHPELLT